jgi:hypothetical protein
MSNWLSWLNFWEWGESGAGRNVPPHLSRVFVGIMQTDRGQAYFGKVTPEILQAHRRGLRKIEPIPRNPPPPPPNPYAPCTAPGIPGIMQQIRARCSNPDSMKHE